MTKEEASAQIEQATQHAIEAATRGLLPLSDDIQREPRGFQAICTAAVLRAFADVIEMQFNEGDGADIGPHTPLKLMVDQVKARVLIGMQRGAKG